MLPKQKAKQIELEKAKVDLQILLELVRKYISKTSKRD